MGYPSCSDADVENHVEKFEIAGSQLHGWSYADASLMGMPHVGAVYRGRANRLEENSSCLICGSPGENAHHAVPKGQGKQMFNLITPVGTFPLRSPLFAVCGSGTTGCHNGFHGGGLYRVRWEWDDPDTERAWWSGALLSDGYAPHDARLWLMGRYVIERRGEFFREVRLDG